MSDQVTEIEGINTENAPIPEARESRERVLQAFNSALTKFDSVPDQNLTPLEQWARKSIHDAKSKTLDQNKDTFDQDFINHETGETFERTQERIPVEHLINFLRQKASSLPDGDPQKEELLKEAHILSRNSTPFYSIENPHRMEPSRLLGRIHHEANLISKDIRATDSEDGNWFKAKDELDNRRELTLPSAEGSPETTPTPTQEPTPEPTSTSTLEPDQQVRREFMIVNRTTDIQKRARELAEVQLRAEMRRGSAFNPLNWPRKIGLRIMEEYHRQRFTERASRAMIANNNSYLDMDVVRNAAIQATNRITEEREAGKAKVEQIKTGELIEGQRVQEVQGQLKQMMMAEIIRPIINGTITEQAQVQQALRDFVQNHQNDPQVLALFGRDANQYGRMAEYFASDLLETGTAIKEDLAAHRYALEALDEVVKISLANTDWAAETQANFHAVDKAVAWVERHRLSGLLINPAVVGAAFSLGTFGVMRAAGYAGRVSQLIVPGAGILPGALFAGFRRNYDLKVDMASHRVERAYNQQIPQGARRREALENYAYNTATVTELIKGGGQEAITGSVRRSMQELLSADLSNGQVGNRENVIRRITEIKGRLDTSSKESRDLITFGGREQVEQGRLDLIKAIVEARAKLEGAGMSRDEIRDMENRLSAEWSRHFIQNREQQDARFFRYRLTNSLGAAAFGGISGLAGGFVSQEAWAAIGRGVFHQEIGNTVLENALSGRPITEWLSGGRAAGFAIDQTKELFNRPGNVPLSKDFTLAVGSDHTASILDSAGKKVASVPLNITSDGKMILSGSTDSFPDPIRDLMNSWESRPSIDPAFNLQEHLKDAFSTGNHETFQHGDWVIDVNSGPDNQMSMTHFPTQTQVHGFLDSTGKLSFDEAFGGNAQLNPQDWQNLQKTFYDYGFRTNIEHIPGQGNVVDELLGKSPDELKSQGIIETDQVKKAWNFHVLRPDVVAETGQHTHNELTLHLGGEYQVAKLSGDQIIPGEVRRGVGSPGQIGTTSELHGGAIRSHLPNIPPQADPVLNNLINKAGGLKWSDIVFVEDLSNGKQIMQAADALGNGRLPSELFNPLTGAPRGIDTIATAIIEGPDGSVIKASDVMAKGIPDGSIVHSLASERFLSEEVPPLPPRDILKVTPPPAFEFTPPLPRELEQPPIIPFPFTPRHPLEPLDRRTWIYYGGGIISPEERSFYERRRSPRLTNNPQTKLDTKEEIEWYFNQQSSEYRQELETLNASLGEAMDNECRVAVCIAAASHQEGKNIHHTLLQYTDQRNARGNPVNPNAYEIILFLNRPEGTTPDETTSEVARFQKEHPEIKIRVVDKIFSTKQTMGVISKYIADLALLRSGQRTSPLNQDLILATNDADADLISKGYIDSIIKEYDNPSKSHIDAALGKIEWNPESYIQYPGFHVANRFIQYIDVARRHSEKNRSVGSSGANFTMKASIYAAIGGYDQNCNEGQDVELSKMIREGRKPKDKPIFRENYPIDYLNPAWIVTNPRRGISYYKEGRPVVRQWNDFGTRTGVREKDWRSGTVSTETIETIDIEHLQNDINATIADYGLVADSEMVRKSLGYLNIEYRVENGQIVITDISRLQEDLRNYAREGRNRINELKNRALSGTPTNATNTTLASQMATPTATPTTPDQEPVAPVNLIDRVNQTLENTADPETTLETTPSEVVDYLKTEPLPRGASFGDLQARIENNQVIVNGSVKGLGSTSNFSAVMAPDASGRLTVLSHQIRPGFTHRPFIGLIEPKIATLNDELINQINGKVDPTWEAAGFKIAGNNLAIDFKKKPGQTSPQPQMNNMESIIAVSPEELEDVHKVTIDAAETAPSTPEELANTEAWANRLNTGYAMLSNPHYTEADKKSLLDIWTVRAKEEEVRITKDYTGQLALTDQLKPWSAQSTALNMLTCQLAATENALATLDIFDVPRHNQVALLGMLGGQNYAQSHRAGVPSSELQDQVLEKLPEIRYHSSNSVSEVLEAVENGAAAIVPIPGYTIEHMGTIQPGHRVFRDRSTNELMVNVIDPLSGPRAIPVASLIKSNITLSMHPRHSNAIIIEKAPTV